MLTEPASFGGSAQDLADAREAASLPILRKDFIVDSLQLSESRALGAAAVLLIVRALPPGLLEELFHESLELDIEPVVEVRSEGELERALAARARVIGVNNRNLHTFEVDLAHTIRLRDHVPDECVLVGESGIKTYDDVRRLEAAGVDAILVGESLSRQADIGAAVDRLLGRAS